MGCVAADPKSIADYDANDSYILHRHKQILQALHNEASELIDVDESP